MGISIWQLLIILAIILLIFGTKRLRNAGSDVGGAIKNFKQAVKEEQPSTPTQQAQHSIDIDSPTVDATEVKHDKTS